MVETLKVASTGRFGARYGVGIRRKLLKVEPVALQNHECPNCSSQRVKRQSRGIFLCTKCLHKFVGGSYLPKTLAGSIISKMVSQRVFAPEMVQSLSKVQGEGEALETHKKLEPPQNPENQVHAEKSHARKHKEEIVQKDG